MRNIDFKQEILSVEEFISEQVRKSGTENVIVGLSGGIDSAVTATLCTKALGKKHVIALMLPYRTSNPQSLQDAETLVKKLQISSCLIDISDLVDSYFSKYASDADKLRKGNWMARIRMCILYDHSVKHNALVAGTGNKSELMTGYCTQYGDNACAFEPLGHLYKTEIYELAELIKIPSQIIKKAPSADLWSEQTDETELGITYSKLDEILYNLIDLGKDRQEVIASGFDEQEVDLVISLIVKSRFKRRMPPTIT